MHSHQQLVTGQQIMVRLTLIARVRDGLPLAEGLDGEKDRDLDSYKHQAKARQLSRCVTCCTTCPVLMCCLALRTIQEAFKQRASCIKLIRWTEGLLLPPAQTLFKRMAQEKAGDSRLSVDSGPFVFHYLIAADVCYLTLTDRAYPKKLAYQYLEELQREFTSLYGQQIEAAARPYAFIKFGADRGG